MHCQPVQGVPNLSLNDAGDKHQLPTTLHGKAGTKNEWDGLVNSAAEHLAIVKYTVLCLKEHWSFWFIAALTYPLSIYYWINIVLRI